jgi:hypothetical protein
VQILDGQQYVARLRRRLLDAEQDFTADHGPGERRLGRTLARHRLDRLAAPQHGDPIRDLEHLVQLVGDEDDRLPVGLQAVDDPEELACFLRRQDGGRLVEDEDVCAPVERLQDLHPLLLADGDLAHERRRIDHEPEALRKLLDAALGRPLVEQDPVAGLDAEDDVLGHGHHRDEHEVLVDHPDPRLDGVARRAERDRLAVEQDLPGVRLVEAVEDVHQRRLAGAVLAQQRVDLALLNVERDVVVGNDAREHLADPSHLENRRVCHSRRS